MGKEVAEVKSSKELLRRLQVKREKGSRVQADKAPIIVPNGQFNLSNFEVDSQNTNTATTAVRQSEEVRQNKGKMEALKGKGKAQFITNKKVIQTINESRARISAIRKTLLEVRAKNNEKKTAQEQKSKSKLEVLEAALLEVGNSNSKHKAPKETVAEEVNSKRTKAPQGNSRGNEQSKQISKSTKRTTIPSQDNSRGNEKKKKVVIEDHESIISDAKKKQSTRLCRSMLIGEFLDENGENVKAVVEEENDLQDEEFQNEIQGEGHEEENVNEGQDTEIEDEGHEEGNNAFFSSLILF